MTSRGDHQGQQKRKKEVARKVSKKKVEGFEDEKVKRSTIVTSLVKEQHGKERNCVLVQEPFMSSEQKVVLSDLAPFVSSQTLMDNERSSAMLSCQKPIFSPINHDEVDKEKSKEQSSSKQSLVLSTPIHSITLETTSTSTTVHQKQLMPPSSGKTKKKRNRTKNKKKDGKESNPVNVTTGEFTLEGAVLTSAIMHPQPEVATPPMTRREEYDLLLATLLSMDFSLIQINEAMAHFSKISSEPSSSSSSFSLPSIQIIVDWITEHGNNDNATKAINGTGFCPSLPRDKPTKQHMSSINNNEPASSFVKNDFRQNKVQKQQLAQRQDKNQKKVKQKEKIVHRHSTKGNGFAVLNEDSDTEDEEEHQNLTALESKEDNKIKMEKEEVEKQVRKSVFEKEMRRRKEFWNDDLNHKHQTVERIIEFCVFEFARQHQRKDGRKINEDSSYKKKAAAALTCELKSDADAMTKLQKEGNWAYKNMFGDRVNRPVKIVNMEPDGMNIGDDKIRLNDRKGVTQEWNESGEIKLVLHSKTTTKTKKRGNNSSSNANNLSGDAEIVFIRPEYLEPLNTNSSASSSKKKKLKKNFGGGNASTHTIMVDELFKGLPLIVSISAKLLKGMDMAATESEDGKKLNYYLEELMEKYDKDEEAKQLRLREQCEREAQREKERKDRDLKYSLKERERADRKQAEREEQRHRSHPYQERGGPRVFVHLGGGMGMYVDPRMFGGGGSGHSFFGRGFFDEDDNDDYDDDYYSYEDDEEEDGVEKFEQSCAILEVLPSASEKEIKSAYRQKARLYHPDKYSGPESANGMSKEESEEQFKIISNAYEYLTRVTDNEQ
mmetsp:Transcript_7800/g.9093  ORF Transcript_7800/g.9093 Transcript_7800/m.9093 type:complete len:834 (+) Transcript_7800:3-2504(+)